MRGKKNKGERKKEKGKRKKEKGKGKIPDYFGLFRLKSVGSDSSHNVGCSSSNLFRIAFIMVSRINSDLFFTR
jgi:hypothetical protein